MVVRPFIDTFRPSPLNETAYPNMDPDDGLIPVKGKPAAAAPALPPRPSKGGNGGAQPIAPSAVSSRSVTAFSRTANVLHQATRNAMNTGDVAALPLLFLGVNDSSKRLEGKVTPAEADAIVAAAKDLPEEQRHILAAAIGRNIASGDLVAVASTEVIPEDGEQRPASAATKTLSKFVAANEPTRDELQIGEILGAADVLLNRAHRALTNVRNGQALSEASAKALDSARTTLEKALGQPRVASSLRTAVITFMRTTIANDRGGFPSNFATIAELERLHALLYP